MNVISPVAFGAEALLLLAARPEPDPGDADNAQADERGHDELLHEKIPSVLDRRSAPRPYSAVQIM